MTPQHPLTIIVIGELLHSKQRVLLLLVGLVRFTLRKVMVKITKLRVLLLQKTELLQNCHTIFLSFIRVYKNNPIYHETVT